MIFESQGIGMRQSFPRREDTKEQIVTDPKYAAFTALHPFLDIVQQALAGINQLCS